MTSILSKSSADKWVYTGWSNPMCELDSVFEFSLSIQRISSLLASAVFLVFTDNSNSQVEIEMLSTNLFSSSWSSLYLISFKTWVFELKGGDMKIFKMAKSDVFWTKQHLLPNCYINLSWDLQSRFICFLTDLWFLYFFKCD